MDGIHFRVSRIDCPLAEFKEQSDAIEYAQRKAREFRGAWTVYVSRVDPTPLGEACGSFRSDCRGHLEPQP